MPSRSPRQPVPWLGAVLFVLSFAGAPAPAARAGAQPEWPSPAIPARAAGAPTGSELLARLAGAPPAERSRALLAELLAGNVPAFMRRLRPVEAAGRGAASRAVFWVTPDYLAVGSDEDHVRVPLGLEEALAVARSFGCTLPTRRMVDAIHRQAELRLEPRPMPPGPEMASLGYLRAHERTIALQLAGRTPGLLVAGDKKDLVLTPRLSERPGRVAIYGWHRSDGRPIQPLSTVHGSRYVDYSHGVRLVSERLLVDGSPRLVRDVLRDPELASLLSDEGPFAGPRESARGADAPPVRRASLR